MRGKIYVLKGKGYSMQMNLYGKELKDKFKNGEELIATFDESGKKLIVMKEKDVMETVL